MTRSVWPLLLLLAAPALAEDATLILTGVRI